MAKPSARTKGKAQRPPVVAKAAATKAKTKSKTASKIAPKAPRVVAKKPAVKKAAKQATKTTTKKSTKKSTKKASTLAAKSQPSKKPTVAPKSQPSRKPTLAAKSQPSKKPVVAPKGASGAVKPAAASAQSEAPPEQAVEGSAKPLKFRHPVPRKPMTPKAAPTVLPVFEAVHGAFLAQAKKAELFGWGVRRTWAEGGEDPLEKVRAYPSSDETPHWHYVTSGLADPDKVSAADTAEGMSGLGYELTFRLARAPEDESPPVWPVMALQELGWGILKAGMKLDTGHYIRRRTPITGGEPPTEMRGYYLVADPQLPRLETTSGRVVFLQLVGLTEDELLQCESGAPDDVEEALTARSPLGITDVARTMPEPADDTERMTSLQRSFAEACLGSIPSGVEVVSLSATLAQGALTCEIDAATPFHLGPKAKAALHRIFLHRARLGQTVERIRGKLAAHGEGGWSTVLEFDYPTTA